VDGRERGPSVWFSQVRDVSRTGVYKKGASNPLSAIHHHLPSRSKWEALESYFRRFFFYAAIKRKKINSIRIQSETKVSFETFIARDRWPISASMGHLNKLAGAAKSSGDGGAALGYYLRCSARRRFV